MNFMCQSDSIDKLKLLSQHRQHGVIICGDSGSGKTYLAKQYAKLLHIDDFSTVKPVMSELKSVIDVCISTNSPHVLCIENLDSGLLQVSYPLLKFIEDCPSNLYIVVTCNNIYRIPDTILSRCALVTISHPTSSDLVKYANSKNVSAYEWISDTSVWGCVKTFGDVDVVIGFTPEKLKYFENLSTLFTKRESVSTLSWKLQNYEDKTKTPISLVIRYLMNLPTINRYSCVECLDDLANSHLGQNAVITKFVLDNRR